MSCLSLFSVDPHFYHFHTFILSSYTFLNPPKICLVSFPREMPRRNGIGNQHHRRPVAKIIIFIVINLVAKSSFAIFFRHFLSTVFSSPWQPPCLLTVRRHRPLHRHHHRQHHRRHHRCHHHRHIIVSIIVAIIIAIIVHIIVVIINIIGTSLD